MKWIQWNSNPIEILNYTYKMINKSEEVNNKIATFNSDGNQDDVHTFLGLIADDITIYDNYLSMCCLLRNVSPDVKVREACITTEDLLRSYRIKLNTRKDTYDSIKKFKFNNKDILKSEDIKFIDRF